MITRHEPRTICKGNTLPQLEVASKVVVAGKTVRKPSGRHRWTGTVTEVKSSLGKVSEEKSFLGKVSGVKGSLGKVYEVKSSPGKVSEVKSSLGKVSEVKGSLGKVSEERIGR